MPEIDNSINYSDKEKVSPQRDEFEVENASIVPVLSKGYTEDGWGIIYNMNSTNWNLKIFVSVRARSEWSSYLNLVKCSHAINERRRRGFGIPLLTTSQPYFSFHTFFTVYKTFIDEDYFLKRGFKERTDQFQYCQVSRYYHWGYTSYVLKFTPDPDDSSKDFEVTMFKHFILPITDFEYRGEIYRWVENKSILPRGYYYNLYKLENGRPSLAQHWNKEKHTINISENKGNPLIGGYIWKFFNIANRYCLSEYISQNHIATLSDAYILNRENAVLTINSTHSNIDRDSIHSVDLDNTVFICAGLVIKKIEEAIGTDRKRQEAKRVQASRN
ncbi:uncharacterized protein RJT21DRAFT_137032 [Scheffersomyces amazonensis]|uniref:uncharacterized protein n=1 Tax=Scheffersomyces amazonensis TaxID=1078765 RepID=UPI00315D0995